MAKKLEPFVLKPLAVKCTDSDCKNNLHCFKATSKMKKEQRAGRCRECGINLVDWKRLHIKDIADSNHTFKAMRSELIRHYFWHVEFAERAINNARRKGTTVLRRDVFKRIKSSIGKPNNPFDGRQTPLAGSSNPIHYAQHATASCCRKCAAYWHDIPTDRELTDDEIEYLTELAMLYFEERMPYLTIDGEYVPSIRKPRS